MTTFRTLIAAYFMCLAIHIPAVGLSASKSETASRKIEVPFRLTTHGSLGTDVPGNSDLAAGTGWTLEAGIRRGPVELFAIVDRDNWMEFEYEVRLNTGVFNAGVGASVLLFDNRVAISVSLGTSTLLFNAIFDKAGQTGIFVDIRPATLRWPITRRMHLVFAPVSFFLMMPVLHDPVLKRLEYRTSIGFEVTL